MLDRMDQPVPYTIESLAADLRSLGLNRGDVVLVHSSLRNIGFVAGGAQAVVQALVNFLMTANPIGLIVLAIAALAVGFMVAYEKVGWFRDGVQSVVGWLKSAWDWVTKLWNLPATVISTTLTEPLNWPNAKVVSGDAVEVVARLKEESDAPLRSHGSLAMNRALMAAGLVDRVQVTLFPVITGQTGLEPIFQGAADFDLELLEHRTLDGHIQELIYRPTLH